MTRMIAIATLFGALLAVAAADALAATPQPFPLIQRNIMSSANVLRQFSTVPAPELWIHVRNQAEADLVKRNMTWLSGLRFGGRTIVVHPPLIVSNGPVVNQLRFFKTLDRQPASALQASMAASVPNLQLDDLSGAFQGITWIASGRLELWLAPNVSRFGPKP